MQSTIRTCSRFRNKIVRTCRYCRTLFSGPSHQHYCANCSRERDRIPRRWTQLHLSTTLLLGLLAGALWVANFLEQTRRQYEDPPLIFVMDGTGALRYPHNLIGVNRSKGWPHEFYTETTSIQASLLSFNADRWEKRDRADLYFADTSNPPLGGSPASTFRKWRYHTANSSTFELKCACFDFVAAVLLLGGATFLLEWAARRSDEIRISRALARRALPREGA